MSYIINILFVAIVLTLAGCAPEVVVDDNVNMTETVDDTPDEVWDYYNIPRKVAPTILDDILPACDWLSDYGELTLTPDVFALDGKWPADHPDDYYVVNTDAYLIAIGTRAHLVFEHHMEHPDSTALLPAFTLDDVFIYLDASPEENCIHLRPNITSEDISIDLNSDINMLANDGWDTADVEALYVRTYSGNYSDFAGNYGDFDVKLAE